MLGAEIPSTIASQTLEVPGGMPLLLSCVIQDCSSCSRVHYVRANAPLYAVNMALGAEQPSFDL